ncbi:MAG: hypothetical protein HIU86_11160 [Acidobacteria bacterium]|nr:hypothetical protein [Acidobacteriota bacterium]
MTSPLQTAARLALGGALVLAGIGHLTFARRGFADQVPEWVPFDTDDTVLVSGAAEIALGSALVALPKERHRLGVLAAVFFAAVFPGNISQFVHHRDGLHLDTDLRRALRLPFQPVLIAVALWSTGVGGRR